MYDIEDKVKICIEGIHRIGTVDEVIINPGTRVVSYIVNVPFLRELMVASDEELTPYEYEHISPSFSRKTNEERLNNSNAS